MNRLVLGVVVLLVSLPACAPQPVTVTREPATLRLVAADSCATLMREAAADYEVSRPWVTVSVQVFNNALVEDALRTGEADLGLLSWSPVGEERERQLWMESFDRDGIAVIVHPESPFSAVDLVQVREIFRGRIQEWQGVVLTVVSREAGSGTRAAFEDQVLDGEEASLNAVVVPSSEAMVDYVASTPTAIGYVSARCLDDRVRALAVNGVAPADEAIAEGRYPIWRELQLASKGEPAGEARQFAQWLLRRNRADVTRRCLRVAVLPWTR